MYEIGERIDEKGADGVATMITGAIAKGLLNETWARGPADLIQAVEDPDRYGARYVRN